MSIQDKLYHLFQMWIWSPTGNKTDHADPLRQVFGLSKFWFIRAI
jgi:hypothetical protein